jgi:hypothetical protein
MVNFINLFINRCDKIYTSEKRVVNAHQMYTIKLFIMHNNNNIITDTFQLLYIFVPHLTNRQQFCMLCMFTCMNVCNTLLDTSQSRQLRVSILAELVSADTGGLHLLANA